MKRQDLERLSRRMSKALRHAPEEFGLELDAGGWVAVTDLVRALDAPSRPVTRELVEQVVKTSDKQRYSLDETRTRIRANQGHSIPVDLGLEPAIPPDRLFHGTVERFIGNIQREGLLPMRRNHVHLSADVETALTVGARRGDPIILIADSAAMLQDGWVFHRSVNGVWLVNSVPPQYLSRLDGAPAPVRSSP